MDQTVHFVIDGLGIAFFSAKAMENVAPGTDFFTAEFNDPKQIAAHIQKGDITAFCTGTGGDFDLHFCTSYPTPEIKEQYPVSVQLGLEVQGGSVRFCDVYWLMDWDDDFPEDQVIPMDDGFYALTACTRMPESGYWGGDQTIYIYFAKVDSMPKLPWTGIPYLFTEE